MRRFLIFILGLLLVLDLGVPLTYSLFVKNNKDVNYWHNLPDQVKSLSIKLELERLWHKLFRPDIDTSVTAKITPGLLRKSVKEGADWIVSMQGPSGRVNYWYNPSNNSFSKPYDDNFLRQAGTSYALMLAYEQTGDSCYLISARHNLEYLNQFKQELHGDKAYYLYNGKAKLGGIALPMLIMVKINKLTNDTSYNGDLKKLANMILYLQEFYKTGQFKSTYVYKGDYNYEQTSGWHSNIYPGEAMLALAMMYNSFGEKKYMNSLEMALNFYGNKGRWKTSSLITWTASAFSELYKATGEKSYADFVFKMCNHTLKSQNLNPHRNVYGSFYGLPGVFTATSFEGVGDAIGIARIAGNHEIVRLYSDRSKIAYAWILKLQYRDDNSVLPHQAVGGFRSSLTDSLIRIDNTQHAISALVKGLRYVYQEKPVIQAHANNLKINEN